MTRENQFSIPNFGSDQLEKEARVGAAGRVLKKITPSSFTREVPSAARAAAQKTPNAQARVMSEGETAAKLADQTKKFRTGSFFVDGTLGGTKKVFPRTKGPIESGVNRFSQGAKNVDAKLGDVARGTDPTSRRFKLFSRNTKVPRVEMTGSGGATETLSSNVQMPSLVATPEKVTKGVAPILGSMYLAEKFFPMDEDENDMSQPQNIEQLSDGEQRNDFGKRASTFHDQSENESSSFDRTGYEMDKQASLQKIAVLENEIEKYAQEVEGLKMEKRAYQDSLDDMLMEKTAIEKRAEQLKGDLMEKRADFDELHYRMIAQERSKSAVDLSEDLLEKQLIKQAEFDDTVDRLMTADDKTFHMYEKMARDYSKDEESVENLWVLREYSNNDKLASSRSSEKGLSRTGQTIGEAASELKQK